ncbi:HAD family hydrolase [Jatrophihabitans sp.]|uniref:HAD family hydrolase n=1 Tax=Jatrophihabitans sp. TaxID=1932789 RepID=UPI002C0F2AF9|nr:HAD-IB family hydrolase [Jatrophihabitans sp.]
MSAHAVVDRLDELAGTAPLPSGRAALFDVDETLISTKSMFDFLAFHLREAGRPRAELDRILAEFAAFAAGGGPREEGNRRFYRIFTGCDWDVLLEQGRRWFAERLSTAALLHPPVAQLLRAHVSCGDTVVLVSGSFQACLEPLAAHLGVGHVLCSRPEVAGGRVTGEVAVPMIGAHKADAARRLLAELGVRRSATWAYADHGSDLQLLELAGHPVAVGDEPAVRSYVERSGGMVLSGIQRLEYPRW